MTQHKLKTWEQLYEQGCRAAAYLKEAHRSETGPKLTLDEYEASKDMFCGMADIDREAGGTMFDILMRRLRIEKPNA